MLPHDLLPKSTVYAYLAQWRDDGTWSQMVEAVRTPIRVPAGREPRPSAVGIDSHSVKTTERGGAERGDDGGKKSQGRQRHLLVDTLGLLVASLSTGAGVDDGAAAPQRSSGGARASARRRVTGRVSSWRIPRLLHAIATQVGSMPHSCTQLWGESGFHVIVAATLALPRG
jgi:transposase